jgi:glycine/D-amino acid oxidase-like deaminating enzyme
VPGGIVEPAALTLGLAAAARRAGAKLFEHAPVKRINRGRSPIVEVAGRRVSCAQVVVALNGWTAALIPIPEMVSALTYALVTAPLEQTTLKALGLAERIPFYTADTPYLWGRVCDDGAIVFGAGLTYGSPAEMEATAITQTEPQAILDGLEKRIRGLHPALARVPITSRWAGPIAFRKGAIPVLARLPEAPNVLVAAAYAGHGVAFSVHAGRLMAAAIIDNATLPPWGAIARDANQS